MKKSGRIAIIVGPSSSIWVSCRSITPNLVESYKRAYGTGVRCFTYLGPPHLGECVNTAKSILEFDPERIIFVEHRPHPELLLRNLIALAGDRLPPIVVHAFGDFTLFSKEWWGLDREITRLRLAFVAASQPQADLIKVFLKNKGQGPFVIPFPVDQSQYYFDSSLRTRTRRSLGIAPDEFTFVYTGRITAQKNSIWLMKTMAEFLKKFPAPVRVLFAGPFDDMGAQFFGIKGQLGNYFQQWNLALDSISPHISRKICYLGNLESSQLQELYNAGDAYISMSLHHDEDYGMAPLEALFCGMPAVLSAWGGYRGFAQIGVGIRLARVSLLADGLNINLTGLLKAIKTTSESRLGNRERQLLRKVALGLYSIESVAKQLMEFHKIPVPRFSGFKPILNQHARTIAKDIPFPGGPKPGGFYEKIYRSYYI